MPFCLQLSPFNKKTTWREGGERVAREWREGGERVVNTKNRSLAQNWREGGEKMARRWREIGKASFPNPNFPLNAGGELLRDPYSNQKSRGQRPQSSYTPLADPHLSTVFDSLCTSFADRFVETWVMSVKLPFLPPHDLLDHGVRL